MLIQGSTYRTVRLHRSPFWFLALNAVAPEVRYLEPVMVSIILSTYPGYRLLIPNANLTPQWKYCVIMALISCLSLQETILGDTSISIGAEAFFLFSTKVNSQHILSTTSLPLVQFVKRPLCKIRVFLDYDNGTVSIYDVFRSSLIYSSRPSPFSSPLITFVLNLHELSISRTIYWSFFFYGKSHRWRSLVGCTPWGC